MMFRKTSEEKHTSVESVLKLLHELEKNMIKFETIHFYFVSGNSKSDPGSESLTRIGGIIDDLSIEKRIDKVLRPILEALPSENKTLNLEEVLGSFEKFQAWRKDAATGRSKILNVFELEKVKKAMSAHNPNPDYYKNYDKRVTDELTKGLAVVDESFMSLKKAFFNLQKVSPQSEPEMSSKKFGPG